MKARSSFPIHVVDYDGREVIITEEAWLHVVEGHDELREHIDAVTETLRAPNYVEIDETVGGSVLPYYRVRRDLIRKGYLLVLVAKTSDDPKAGRFMTAYLVRNIKEGGTMVWLKR